MVNRVSSAKARPAEGLWATALLLAAAFLCLFNQTSVNLALVPLMSEFSISADIVQWLSTGFMLVVGMLAPVAAFLIGRFTTRQLYFAALVLLVMGGLLAGFAPGFSVLLIGRLLQAAAAGIILPLLFNTIVVVNEPERRGAAMGLGLLVVLAAPAIGPLVGGLAIQLLGWRWLFLGIVPLVLVAMISAYVRLTNVTEVKRTRPDVLSFVLSSTSFAIIIYGFSKVGYSVSDNMTLLVAVLIGSIGLSLFIWRQLSIEEPILEIRTLRYPMFAIGVVLNAIVMMAFFANMIMLPMFLQGSMAMTALGVGLVMLPGGLLNGVLAPVCGRLFDSFGPRALAAPGLLIASGMLLLLAVFLGGASIGAVVAIQCGFMLGAAMVMTPTQANALNQLPPKYYPHGTAMMNTMQQMGAAVGSALFVGIMSSGRSHYLSSLAGTDGASTPANALMFGVERAYGVAALLLFFGFLLSLFLRRAAHRPAVVEEWEPVAVLLEP